MVESEGELTATQATETFQPYAVGSGIPPRLLGHEIFQLRQVSGVFLYHCPHTTCWSRLNQADTAFPAIWYPGLSVRGVKPPTKEIRIGLRRMVTRIHKAIKFTPHQIPLNELIQLLFKAVRGRAQPTACRNTFRQPRGQRAPAGSVHTTVVSRQRARRLGDRG